MRTSQALAIISLLGINVEGFTSVKNNRLATLESSSKFNHNDRLTSRRNFRRHAASSVRLHYRNSTTATVDYWMPVVEQEFQEAASEELATLASIIAKDVPTTTTTTATEIERKDEVKSTSSVKDKLIQHELRFLKSIQQTPGLRPLSLAVHYSLLPSVVTPALAMIAWLVSLPAAASLICFLCAQDMINTAIKWAVMRPRPLWYSKDTGLDVKYGTACGEADYSFPSAHTQFFSGLAFCACVLFGGSSRLSLALACAFGTVIGLTRNHLGVHWPTDTMFGLLLGGTLGTLWGTYDPYTWLLQQGSPLLSLGVATGLTGGLALLVTFVKSVVNPIDDETFSRWSENMSNNVESTCDCGDEDTATPAASSFMPSPRELRSKIAMLSTVWCTLAFTALCPAHLPTAMAEPAGCIRYRLMSTLVGMSGLAGTGAILKKTFVNNIPTLSVKKSFTWLNAVAAKPTLKGFAYAGICAWTFLLTQLVSRRLFAFLAAV